MGEGPALKSPVRPRLDREVILNAAEAIVRTEGVGKLTMRRIGTALGADPTAVYRHFRNKQELLVQLADRLFAENLDTDPAVGFRELFKAELRHAMHRYRSHPDLSRLLAVTPDDMPGLQSIAEWTLARLAEQGLTPEQAGFMYQVIENHVVGAGLYFSLVEHADDPRLNDPPAMRRVYAMLPQGEFPYAVEAAPHLWPGFDESFDFGTEMIVDTIERLARQNTAAPPHPTDDGGRT